MNWKATRNYFSLLGVRKPNTSMIGKNLKPAKMPELFNGALVSMAIHFYFLARQSGTWLSYGLAILLAAVGIFDLGTFPRGHVIVTGLMLFYMMFMLITLWTEGLSNFVPFAILLSMLFLTLPPEVFHLYQTRIDIVFQKLSIPGFLIYTAVR